MESDTTDRTSTRLFTFCMLPPPPTAMVAPRRRGEAGDCAELDATVEMFKLGPEGEAEPWAADASLDLRGFAFALPSPPSMSTTRDGVAGLSCAELLLSGRGAGSPATAAISATTATSDTSADLSSTAAAATEAAAAAAATE